MPLFGGHQCVASELLRKHGDLYEPGTRVMLELGELIPAAQYVHAQRSRAVLRDRVRETFTTHALDGLVGPTLPMTTVPLSRLSTSLEGEGETALSAYVHHCFLGNVVGLPGAQLPVRLQLGRPADRLAGIRPSAGGADVVPHSAGLRTRDDVACPPARA